MYDIQKLMNAISASAASARSDYHLTLGGAIAALEAVAPETPVMFDIGGSPFAPHSYRGYYSDLSLKSSAKPRSAGQVLTDLREALGETFGGYKGGDYTMTDKTPLWTAPYGTTGRAVMAAEMRDGSLVLITKEID